MTDEQIQDDQSSNEQESRLEHLEKEVQALKASASSKYTPVLYIALVAALVVYALLLWRMPLPEETSNGARWGIGIAIGYASLLIFAGAGKFVQFAFRGILEILIVLVVLLNAAAGAAVWVFLAYLCDLVSTHTAVKSDDVVPVVIGLAACTLFVSDVVLMLFLYPASNIVGSNAFEI